MLNKESFLETAFFRSTKQSILSTRNTIRIIEQIIGQSADNNARSKRVQIQLNKGQISELIKDRRQKIDELGIAALDPSVFSSAGDEVSIVEDENGKRALIVKTSGVIETSFYCPKCDRFFDPRLSPDEAELPQKHGYQDLCCVCLEPLPSKPHDEKNKPGTVYI